MTSENINQFFSFLDRGTLGEIVFWLKIIAGVIASVLLGFIAIIGIKFREIGKGAVVAESAAMPEKLPPDAVDAAWREVLAKIESVNPSDWNIAVIRADSIFDGILKNMNLPGENMGERLKQLDAAELQSLNSVWEAHKIRNRIAHETDQTLTHDEARRAISLFENGLKELGYLAA